VSARDEDLTPARMPSPTVEVLQYVGVPPQQITGLLGRLVVLLAQRYGLDPALRHVEVIPHRNRPPSVYITADGWRYIADRSGDWVGLTFTDVSRGGSGWRATAQVWKRGAKHPFEGRAGCGDAEQIEDPEAMAMTRATRRALRNAFASRIRVEPEYAAVYEDADEAAPPAAPVASSPRSPAADVGGPGSTRQAVPGPSPAPAGSGRHDLQRAARQAFNELSAEDRDAFVEQYGLDDLGAPWPDAALDDLLGGNGA
jgi:hypothetical protein